MNKQKSGSALMMVILMMSVVGILSWVYSTIKNKEIDTQKQLKIVERINRANERIRQLLKSPNSLEATAGLEPLLRDCLFRNQGPNAFGCTVATDGVWRNLPLVNAEGTPQFRTTPVNLSQLVDDFGNTCNPGPNNPECMFSSVVEYSLPVGTAMGQQIANINVRYTITYVPADSRGSRGLAMVTRRTDSQTINRAGWVGTAEANTCGGTKTPVGVRGDGSIICEDKIGAPSCTTGFITGFDNLGRATCSE